MTVGGCTEAEFDANVQRFVDAHKEWNLTLNELILSLQCRKTAFWFIMMNME